MTEELRTMSMIRRRRLLPALAAALLALVLAPPSSAAPATRVLFIGNSYTYFNNLPALVKTLAEAAGTGPVEVRMVAPGGWRLIDHWEKGEAREALRSGKWDFVVLQEQSQLGDPLTVDGKPRVGSPAKVFAPAAARWAAEIARAGARPVFYLTWAKQASPEDQALLNQAYSNAATEGGAVLAPVGIAWTLVREASPSIELFVKDGSHPSPAGSYLAACTLVAAIFRRNPEGLTGRVSGAPVNLETEKPEDGRTAVLADLPAAVAGQLQAAAWKATGARR
jgi:hypothetical protein